MGIASRCDCEIYILVLVILIFVHSLRLESKEVLLADP